jgi:hypothetical protein
VLYTEINTHFLSYLAYFFLKREMFQTKAVEKTKTHILCSITFLKKSCLYEKMWKNTVERGRPQMKIWRMRIACWMPTPERGRPQMTIWRMRIACWIPKATNKRTEYVLLTAFALQQWLHERASMLGYTSIVCLAEY